MITLLSPSKSMDTDIAPFEDYTNPDFLKQSQTLIHVARTLSTEELERFMQISPKLAALNHQRFIDWHQPFTPENAKPALHTFTGDVYDGLDAPTLPPVAIKFAQSHLRILSGLYGLLRPLDLIQPYRLEMGRPLKTEHANTLYEFWRPAITEALNQLPGKRIINLASQEYFKVIHKPSLKKEVITPVFKDTKNGKRKIISFYAKKARGAMARYIVENQISTPEELTLFNSLGYQFSPEESTPASPLFTRPEQA